MRAAWEVQVQAGSEVGAGNTTHSYNQVSCHGGPTLASSELEFQHQSFSKKQIYCHL